MQVNTVSSAPMVSAHANSELQKAIKPEQGVDINATKVDTNSSYTLAISLEAQKKSLEITGNDEPPTVENNGSGNEPPTVEGNGSGNEPPTVASNGSGNEPPTVASNGSGNEPPTVN